jgi:two-component system response regulator AtoC
MTQEILIIHKEKTSRELLLSLLKKNRCLTTSVADLSSALPYLKEKKFDLIFSDTPLKGAPHILLSQNFTADEALLMIKEHFNPISLIAESPSMKQLLSMVTLIAKSQANVFITGESGTGKEVIAGLIHHLSPRAKAPFIKVNCAAIPEHLIESEFFGHEKGSFTGAHVKRLGRFELAHEGTLLLDEVSEISFHLQSKLLRIIQEMEFERVGGSESIHVNVRLISTSNQDMRKMLSQQSFREDLYYRLNVIPLHIPPLRERPEDILPLANHFLRLAALKNHMEIPSLSPSIQEELLSHSWPGNARELMNAMEYFLILKTLKKGP